MGDNSMEIAERIWNKCAEAERGIKPAKMQEAFAREIETLEQALRSCESVERLPCLGCDELRTRAEKAEAKNARLRAALEEALDQIAFLHRKYGVTASGNVVMSHGENVLKETKT